MRSLAIDVRAALVPQPTGKGQWLRGFLPELLSRNTALTLLTDSPVPRAWLHAHVEVKTFPHGHLWHLRSAHFLRKNCERFVFFSPTSFIVPFLLGSKVPTVPLVHDLIAFRGEPHDRKARIIEHLTLGRALCHAAHICTVSTATKNSLLSRFPFLNPERISLIFAGPSEPGPPSNVPDGRTILTVGTLCPRKNQLRLIRAYASLPENVRARTRLVLAGGRGWNDREIVDAVTATSGVEWLGYVSDAHYHDLLHICEIFAFPSLEEGFGLPVLDALQRGTLVLTSTRGGLREVAGEAAVTVDPGDTQAIRKGLETLLHDQQLRERLRAAGPAQARQFSWKQSVDLFLNAVQPLL